MKDFRLSDLIDLEAVQKMAESHYQSTGMPIGIIDAFDHSVLVGIGWQDICLNYHRVNPDSLKRCHASDSFIKQNLKIGEACKYKCKNGLWDIGIPIVVKERHLATLFIGQFFYEGEVPDREFFLEQARKFNFDLDGYLSALGRVPVFNKKKVDSIIDYDKALATFLIDLAEKALLKKKADNELQKARNFISSIIDSMPSMLICIDGNGKITQWNKQAEILTGLAFDEVLSQPLVTILPHLKGEISQIQNAITTQQVVRDQRVCVEDQDAIRYEDITIFPLMNGDIEGVVIQIEDVTEKIHFEELLIQNEKMTSVGGLAAGMAHEINNPLAAIIQSANVLSNRLTNKTMPANIEAAESVGITMEQIHGFMEVRSIPRMIRSINESGLRMSSIVKNMLSFARKSDASFTTHDPVELMDNTLALARTDYSLKEHYDFKSITIQKEYQDNLPMIACEGGKIQQVLLNLLNNGAYAMFHKKKDSDAFEPKFVLRLSHEKKNDTLRIEIEDNGIGMNKVTCKKIFEPFFTTKPVGIGTGLGVSISYFIITRNHSGNIDVRSEPGNGTNFIITLPLKTANSHLPKAGENNAGRTEPPTESEDV